MTCIIEDNHLVIRLPLQTPTPSASGKTLLVASTHGPAKAGVTVEGKPVSVNVSAWIKPDKAASVAQNPTTASPG